MFATKKWVDSHYRAKSIDVSTRRWDVITGGDFDASIFAFGYEIDGRNITINNGMIYHGTRTPVVVEEKQEEIIEDRYFYVEYDLEHNTASISSGVNIPQNTSTILRILLYYFKVENGQVVLDKIYHIGNINIYSVFA